jgi:phosphohistidine phosphatase
MIKLVIVRHAKSSWDNPELDDFDRPLNNRGKKDAPEMGRRLAQRNITPDKIITSPAKRAAATAKRIAAEIFFPKKNISKEPAFYEASVEDFLSVLKEVSQNVKTLMIFSHNPGLTNLANYLSNAGIYNIPTCGVVEIEFENSSWSAIGKHSGKMVSFDYPKKEMTSA